MVRGACRPEYVERAPGPDQGAPGLYAERDILEHGAAGYILERNPVECHVSFGRVEHGGALSVHDLRLCAE